MNQDVLAAGNRILDLALDPARLHSCLPCLIIRLIIQTILLYPSGAIRTDEALNVSRLDPSGAV